MKFSLSWLRDYLKFDHSLEEVVERLTMIGLEVESVDNPAEKLAPFKVVEVLTASQHPDADRLQVLSVNTGEGEPVQVVCGASNARAGMKGVLGTPGSYVPGLDITLSVGKIRGVESRGMMCSGKELEVSEDAEGILDLPSDAAIGTPYADYADLNDPVIEIGVTPNRPDVLGVYGIARDLAASGLGTLIEKTPKSVVSDTNCPVSVTVEDHTFCPAFSLRLVSGVKNASSPDWMQKRLRSIGLRPINALVDITNYMTFDRGRPLHVFDAAKVAGNLSVRPAAKGEKLLALDGKEYVLDSSMTVIADDNGAESLAGIMGGEASGCDETTTDVLIESALWNEMAVARTGRKLGINSDARYRFERGVDPAFMISGLEEATTLVLDICGGEATKILQVGEVPQVEESIDFPLSDIPRLVGISPDPRESIAILRQLGFWVSGDAPNIKVARPSYRPDIFGRADLVEEIVRIYGINDVPSTPLPNLDKVTTPILTLSQKRNRRAKRALAARGMMEAITWSFVSEKQAKLFDGGTAELKLANPISNDMSDMRPSLLPGLLTAAGRNADRGYNDVAIFEVGQVFKGETPEKQYDFASGIRRGTATSEGAGRHWSGNAQTVSVYDAKEDAFAAIAAIGGDPTKMQVVASGPDYFHPGRCGTIQLGPKNIIGYFGEFHPKTLEELDISGAMVGFELNLQALPAPKIKPTKTKGAIITSDLQPVRRDFAFIVDKTVPAEKLLRAAKGADKKLIADVILFDIFEGEAIGADKTSLAIEVTLQPTQKTLNDEEIEAVSDKIIAMVQKATGASLRG